LYRHRHFVAQIALLREAFGIEADGVDLPTFPPFALFDPALGLTSVIPDMDPTKPALADPRKLHDAIARFGIDQLFGSPALMGVLARHGEALPTLRRVTSAGAPVPADVVARMRELLPGDAQFWTPYGATECLPVAVIEGRELQATRCGRNRRRHLRRPRRGAERGAHHPHRRRRDRAWSDDCVLRTGRSARSPSPAPPQPTATTTAKRRRAGEDPRTPAGWQ
jgi:acyl-CoA synthetase (AMP-forming)/AMP-acid ligase II